MHPQLEDIEGPLPGWAIAIAVVIGSVLLLFAVLG